MPSFRAVGLPTRRSPILVHTASSWTICAMKLSASACALSGLILYRLIRLASQPKSHARSPRNWQVLLNRWKRQRTALSGSAVFSPAAYSPFLQKMSACCPSVRSRNYSNLSRKRQTSLCHCSPSYGRRWMWAASPWHYVWMCCSSTASCSSRRRQTDTYCP